MKKENIKNESGFTLIELAIIIVILGVLATVATTKFNDSFDDAYFESAQRELKALSFAIAGNPDLISKGARTDFGYIGDNGALPPNLDALATNPGLATWDGPYISSSFDNDEFKKDPWGVDYIYNDTLIRSSGSGDNIDYVIAPSSDLLLNNSVSGYILDASNEIPGPLYKDSLSIELIYPDGAGNIAVVAAPADARGNFSFGNIPIGNHMLRIVFIPDSDTMTYNLCVLPGSDMNMEILYPTDLW